MNEEANISKPPQDDGAANAGDKSVPKETQAGPIEEVGFGEKKASFHRWVPRRWEAKYDQIVLAATLGLSSNKELAETHGYTPQQISNILNTPQAAKIRKAVHDKIQKDISSDLPMRLERVAAKSVERLENLVNNDAIAENKPMEIGHLALKILSGVGKMKGDNHDRPTSNTFIFASGDIADLKNAIALSDEASKMHAPKLLKDPFEIVKEKAG